MDSINNIYDRQKTLDLKIPDSVAVIGLGGVGSWVALNFALTGVKKLVLVDFDIVEETNLNRTPFRKIHVGISKAEAIMQLIYERRDDVEVIVINKRVEDCNEYELREIENCDEIIDCRDTIENLPKRIEEKAKKITCGYDGFKITIHLNRNLNTVWREGHTTYTITPSWLVPPQFLASLICLYICCGINVEKEKIITRDVRDIFNKLLEVEGRK